MCGRFSTSAKGTQVLYREYLEAGVAGLGDHYDIRPATPVAVLRQRPQHAPELVAMKWGLLPHWAKEPKLAYSTFNARAESVESKPTFSRPFRRSRCLIPANGWYEWQQAARGIKVKWWLHRPDGASFSFAGLWDRWEREGQVIESCTIIVGASNKRLSEVHDRMPVIIDPRDYAFWLDPGIDAVPPLKELLQPAPDEWFEARRVRNDKHPRDDDVTLVEEIEA